MPHYVLFNCATESEVLKMSPRTGRPKALEPKTVEVKARIDVKTNDVLISTVKNTMSQEQML